MALPIKKLSQITEETGLLVIKAKVIYAWKSIEDGGKGTALHMLLLDEESTTIQATIAHYNYNQFGSRIIEGSTYSLSNFKLFNNKGDYKITDHKFKIYCFEALDRSMRDALRGVDGLPSIKPFGGKVVVFGGDFRQILPVIPKGTRQNVVFAALNSSSIWYSCKVFRLTKNMRLQSDVSNASEMRDFAEWILKLGDGKLGAPNDGEVTIKIPKDILIMDFINPIAAIVESTYPNLLENMAIDNFFQDRAVLAPTNEIVTQVNDYVLSVILADEKVYLSSDSISKSDGYTSFNNDAFSIELLNTIKCSGLPNHEIRLKKGAPVMLLRNIDPFARLCNGTRLVVNHLGDHVIEATILTGSYKGSKVLIPRITFTPSNNSRLPIQDFTMFCYDNK